MGVRTSVRSVQPVTLEAAGCDLGKGRNPGAGDRGAHNHVSEDFPMRYLVEGVARDVAAGKRVLVAMPRMVEAREVFRRVAESGDWSRVQRTNGMESVEHDSGGRAWFRSASSHGVRGVHCDVLVVVGDVADRDELLPAVVPGGEVARL